MPSLSVTVGAEQVLDLADTDRDGVLRALVEAAARDAGVDAEALLAAVHEREALSSTGFGGGVAMPHVRFPGVKRFHTVLGRVRRGVEFAALDEQPVRLFLLIVGPEAEKDRYRKLMKRAAEFLKQESDHLVESPDLGAAAAEALRDY